MHENRPFIRKVIYTCVIAALLLPIAMLSMPAGGGRGSKRDAGGFLAQARAEHDLAQSSLGDVDPTSATVNLACLGMRPIAANILWLQAHEYKKREDWTNLKSSVDTIVTLQPHFIAVWDFQGWNLAYNVSVEWDDYRDRYFWVMEGVKFLDRGTSVNREDPTLFFKTGWVVSQKVGKADEKEEFRGLFRDDLVFHGEEADPEDGSMRDFRPERERDNWLVGKDYYLMAQRIIDASPKERKKRVKGTEPYMFHADIPRNTMSYAEAREDEGFINEVARAAWARGGIEWSGTEPSSYGMRYFKTPGGEIRFNDRELFEETAKRKTQELEEMAPGVRERLIAQRRDKLTPAQVAAYDLPMEQRNTEQMIMAQEASDAMKVTHSEVARGIEDAEKRAAAVALAEEIEKLELQAYWINRRRETINFDYWSARCQAEQTRNALDARSHVNNAIKAAPTARFEQAQDEFEEGFEHWRLVLLEYPVLLKDSTTAVDLAELIVKYRRVLGHLDEEFPVTGYGLISATEIKDWTAFCDWLSAESEDESARTPAARIWQWWSQQRPWGPTAQRAVQRVADGGKLDRQTKNDIMYAVNRAIKYSGLYEAEYFASAKLTPELSERLDERDSISARQLRQLNRQLLEHLLADLIEPAEDEFSLGIVLDQHPDTAKMHDLPSAGIKPPEDSESEGDPAGDAPSSPDQAKPPSDKAPADK